MTDTRFCTAGRNPAGEWLIACNAAPGGSRALLAERGYEQAQSTPPDRHYDHAARHVRRNGGLFWTTNACGEYTTIAGIPEIPRDRRA